LYKELEESERRRITIRIRIRIMKRMDSSGDTMPNSEKSSMVSLRQVSFGKGKRLEL